MECDFLTIVLFLCLSLSLYITITTSLPPPLLPLPGLADVRTLLSAGGAVLLGAHLLRRHRAGPSDAAGLGHPD